MPCPTSPILPVQEAHAQIHPFLPPERPIPKFISKKQATQKKSCNPRRLSSYAQRTSSPRKKNSPWANGFGRIGGRAGTTGAGAGITGKAGGVSTSGSAHSPTKNMDTYFEMNVFQVLPNSTKMLPSGPLVCSGFSKISTRHVDGADFLPNHAKLWPKQK